MWNRRFALGAACAGFGLLLGTAGAAEFGQNSRYYEDDAWYDVTEWFDGNDYNPTDEAIGRWDNESFSFNDNRVGGDRDNDWNYGDYGYSSGTAGDDRWFYDYYDDGYGAWYGNGNAFDSYNWYYDKDDDGLYDAYSSYYDSNGDGSFDRYVYRTFDDGKGAKGAKGQKGDAQTAGSTSGSNAKGDKNNAQSGQQQAADRMKDAAAKQEQISGTVQDTKTVQVHGTKHLVAQVQTKDGQSVAVDLGTQANKPQNNAQLQASGPRLKVGDKSVIIARQAQLDGNEVQIQRDGRKYQGKVENTREVSVGGQKHLLAKVKTDDNKNLLVDLGRADKLSKAPQKGEQVTVQGVPIKVRDRVVLMAHSLTRDGDSVQIDRQPVKNQGAKQAGQSS